jgi:hypothetical protein
MKTKKNAKTRNKRVASAKKTASAAKQSKPAVKAAKGARSLASRRTADGRQCVVPPVTGPDWLSCLALDLNVLS